MKEQGVKDLGKKILSEQATPEERKQFLEMEEMRNLMKRQWDSSDGKFADAKVEKRMWKQIAGQCKLERSHQSRRIALLCCAAGIAALLVIGAFYFTGGNKNIDRMEYVSVVANEARVLSLPDQSKVWMQPGSTVRYAQTFNEKRDVWLEGDATFEVTKQAGRTFRVHIAQAFIEVKGTVFHVNNRNKEMSKVILYNGKVDFHSQTDGRVVAMKPSECLTYHSNGDIVMNEIGNIYWQDGMYKFAYTRLDSLIGTIKEVYDIDIELAADIPGHYLFNGAIYYNERPSEIAEKICYTMNLKYKRENGKLIIYKPKEIKKLKSN